MLMRLNLDKVTHPIHCYYPASCKKYFDRLRYGTAYHETINVVEHPVCKSGVVHDDGHFKIEAEFLQHGIANVAWKVTEPAQRKFDPAKLKAFNIRGLQIRQLIEEGSLKIDGRTISLDEVSQMYDGDSIVVIIDTEKCPQAVDIAKNASLLLCESTYLEEHLHLAHKHHHLTAKQAAQIAEKAGVKNLILTHFSARYFNLKDFANEAREIFPATEVAEDFRTFPIPKTR